MDNTRFEKILKTLSIAALSMSPQEEQLTIEELFKNYYNVDIRDDNGAFKDVGTIISEAYNNVKDII